MRNTLRELRSKEGMSQAEIAKILKVSRQTINSIEKGKYDPSLPLAFRIAGHFGLKIEEIFVPD
ncbi:MAG: helix-turn-helix transcriptional regulator [Pseudomonadota bacterium]|uniref:helix-turn-helix transcriptional regulator n=1 Tax=Alcanivorax sp. NBRC 102024 TaxID=1113895 RepID=UPI000789D2CE|nr:helix-turn-helix transcriptional regulator [Alcanivorax sp. NBRC 102024]MEE2602132.1 helix-turn-helix transcriptional regulator [Pseudomonadota bacterium]